MPVVPAEYVQVAGKNDILFAFPSTAPLEKIGECEDMIDYRETAAWNDVSGDRHGGPQGHPIEVQWLGEVVQISMDLSRWNVARVKALRAHGNCMPVLGTVDLDRMGTLMLLTNSVRLVIRSNRIDGYGNLITGGLNYPACLVREPIAYGTGTKYSGVSLQFEAHRAPEAHPFHGIVWDNNVVDGVTGSNPLPTPSLEMTTPIFPF